ncbi:MAG: AsmA family protein, partial [Alphaproteobacteria bacterium]
MRDLHLQAPHLRLERTAGGVKNWTMDVGIVARLAGGSQDDARIGDISVDSGRITYTDAVSARRINVTDIAAAISWRSVATDLAVSGGLRWRGVPVDFDATMREPANLIRGGATALRLSLTSVPLKLSFTGSAAHYDAYQVEGRASLSSSSLRAAIGLFGRAMEPGPIPGAASLTGDVNWIGPTLSVDDATLELDGNAAEGVLTMTLEPIPRLQGTLAFDRLDLSPYLDLVHAGLKAIGDVSPAGLPALTALRTDLRLSANKTIIGDFETGAAAAAVTSGDGAILVTLGELALAGGNVTGRLGADTARGALAADADLTFSGVDAETLLAALGLPAVVEGDASGSLELRAVAAGGWPSLGEISGRMDVNLGNGVVHGFGADQLQAAMRADGDGQVARDESTRFSSLTAALTLNNAVVAADIVRLETPDLVVDFAGAADLAAGTIEARGTARPAGEVNAPASAIAISGPFDNLRVVAVP